MSGPINRSAIIAKLQRDLLPLQGFKTVTNSELLLPGLGAINSAFPHACFPLGAIHEFISSGEQDNAATSGFVAGILGALVREGAPAIWIGGSSIFPNALFSYGIPSERIIFMDQAKPREMLWAMEEALKCEGLAAVVGEIPDLSFTVSRRLQLAVEQSRVTGFILRCKPLQVGITACIARWKIKSLPSKLEEGMPGVGYPRWNVELVKTRNGRPGNWQVEFGEGQFRELAGNIGLDLQHKKTG